MNKAEEWTCGHIATSTCAECQKILTQKLNELQAEVDRLLDLVCQHERRLSMSVAGA